MIEMTMATIGRRMKNRPWLATAGPCFTRHAAGRERRRRPSDRGHDHRLDLHPRPHLLDAFDHDPLARLEARSITHRVPIRSAAWTMRISTVSSGPPPPRCRRPAARTRRAGEPGSRPSSRRSPPGRARTGPGRRSPPGFGNAASTRIVPVCGSTARSTKTSVPFSGWMEPSARTSSNGSAGRPRCRALAPARKRKSRSGMLKRTWMVSTWEMWVSSVLWPRPTRVPG